MLEPEAAAMAALRADEEIKVALRRELDRMFDAGDRVEDLVEADAAFHDVIGRAPVTRSCAPCSEPVDADGARAPLARDADRVALDTARAEHTRIYEAIVAADPISPAPRRRCTSPRNGCASISGPTDDVPLRDVPG